VEDVAGFAPFQGDLVGVRFEQGKPGAVEQHGRVDAAGIGGIHVDDAVALARQALDQVAHHVFVFDLLEAEDVRAGAVVHARNHLREVVELGFVAHLGPAGGDVVGQEFVVAVVVGIVHGVVEVFDVPVGHEEGGRNGHRGVRRGRLGGADSQSEEEGGEQQRNGRLVHGQHPLRCGRGCRCRARPGRGAGPARRGRTGARGFRGGPDRL